MSELWLHPLKQLAESVGTARQRNRQAESSVRLSFRCEIMYGPFHCSHDIPTK